MALAPGIRLGPYEIVAAVGAGGMGEVYRARDTRLDRIVAIKVLPSHLATDPQLRERFDREARAISSLNHPHICALFDVGHDDVDYLVLEFLEGRTLADRLAAGPLAVAEALRYAVEIADALDKAHRAGIVHRDLKPANVMITKAGAKLLDFGLAKRAAPVVTPSGLSMMPTTPHGVTAQGTILGTFQYMAPEQIEGLEADARTDIFAFGAMLFEMLTGRAAFEGKTRASLLGAILKDEPSRVSSVQPLAPTALDRIVSTCLAKDPEDRFQTARDLVRELNWVASGPGDSRAVAAPDPRHARGTNRPARIIAGMFALALLAAGALLWQLRSVEPAAAVQFALAAPDNLQFGGPPGGGTGQAAQVSMSPNGRDLVFVAADNTGYSLWIRPIGALAARRLAGTEGAAFPFWSPDSRFVAFFAGGKIKKIQPSGGPAIVLCDAPAGRGGSWNEANVIVFAPASSGTLRRVSAAGGVPTDASTLDNTYGETNHRYPHFLPDGRHFLFTAVTGATGVAPRVSRIKIGSLDSAETATIVEVESSAAYASGHVLYLRDGTLMAQPFDPRTLKTTGDGFPIAEQVGTESSRYATFTVSRTGVLAYGHGNSGRTTQLTWYDRAGKVLGTLGEPGIYTSTSLSPDQRQVAVGALTGSPPNRDVWIIDIARGVSRRLTFDPGDDTFPVWSSDGSRIAFSALRQTGGGIRVTPASGAGGDELLVPLQSVARGTSDALTASALPPADWSKDGKFVAYVFVAPPRLQIWILPMSGDAKPFPFSPSPLGQDSPAFSPDGKWLAYTSFESGLPQVYVQSFPAGHGKYLVSKNGGGQPLWRGDGREIFFATEDSIMAVDIDATQQFEAGIPKMLFQIRVPSGAVGRRTYAVTRDGQRFLLAAAPGQERVASAPLTVVVNWLAAVQK